MKVVLFCGGMGMRLRDYSEQIPKPLVTVGSRPILWHLMKYYAHFGHKDFILCLGHGANSIKDYFLTYNECLSNDFVLSAGGRHIDLLHRDIDDWRIMFVDTGLHSNIGQRLSMVRPHLANEEVFLANYADGLSDVNLTSFIDRLRVSTAVAAFMTVPAPHTFHIVHADAEDHATKLEAVAQSSVRINAGFFVLRQEIFEYIRPGDELVLQPFERLIAKRQLLALPHDGFWRNMDTFKDKMQLDELVAQGNVPWQVWRKSKSPVSLA